MKIISISTAILLLTTGLATQGADFDQTHASWNKVLSEYVVTANKTTKVKYAELSKKQDQLDSYLQTVSAVNSAAYNTWNEKQKQAFLFNAYNAFTLKLIVQELVKNSELKSIKKIGHYGQRRFGPGQGVRQLAGIDRHSLDMAAGVVVAGLDHIRQHAYRLQVGRVRVEALDGLPPLQSRGDGQDQVVGVKGLEEEVIGAELAGLRGGGRLGAGREEQKRHRRSGRVGAHVLKQREAVHVRHHDVRNDQVGRLTLESLEGVAAVGRASDPITLAFEDFADHIQDVAVVFGY